MQQKRFDNRCFCRYMFRMEKTTSIQVTLPSEINDCLERFQDAFQEKRFVRPSKKEALLAIIVYALPQLAFEALRDGEL